MKLSKALEHLVERSDKELELVDGCWYYFAVNMKAIGGELLITDRELTIEHRQRLQMKTHPDSKFWRGVRYAAPICIAIWIIIAAIILAVIEWL